MKINNNFHLFLFNTFRRRNGQLLALLSRLGIVRLGDRLLTFRRAIAAVHVLLNRLVVFLNILNDLVFQRPFEKIELTDGGLNAGPVLVWNTDSVPAAKRVETALAVSFEFELVIDVNLEPADIAELVGNRIQCIVFLCIIGGKPIDDTERNFGIAGNDFQHGI